MVHTAMYLAKVNIRFDKYRASYSKRKCSCLGWTAPLIRNPIKLSLMNVLETQSGWWPSNQASFLSSFQAAGRWAGGGPSPLTCPPSLQATTFTWLSSGCVCPLSAKLSRSRWTSTTPTGMGARAHGAQRSGCSWAGWELTPARPHLRPPGGCSTWPRRFGAGCSGILLHRAHGGRLPRVRRWCTTPQATGSWWWSS